MFSTARILLSPYWKARHWTFKKKMGTIPLALKRVMPESLIRQKKKNVTALQCANLIYVYKEIINITCTLKGQPTYIEGPTLTQVVTFLLTWGFEIRGSNLGRDTDCHDRFSRFSAFLLDKCRDSVSTRKRPHDGSVVRYDAPQTLVEKEALANHCFNGADSTQPRNCPIVR
jgi:hypothetical protein